MPIWAYAYITRPEQSKPLGDEPPQTYGTPMYWSAIPTTPEWLSGGSTVSPYGGARLALQPGDTLKIDHGQVYVNGAAVKEPYVPKRFADDRSQPEMTIPAHEYFVMGDHRSISSDSRDFGPVSRDLIYGRAAFVYWPVDQAGVVH